MKKTFLFSLGLIVAIASLFVSCSEKEPVYYNVSVNSSEGGKANFSGNYLGNSMVVDEGESITVVAVPDEGCVFIGWYLGNSGTLLSSELTYTTIVNDNFSLLAQFGKLQDIAIGSGDGGSASFKDSEEKNVHLLPGEDVTVVATPDENYDFLGWFIVGGKEPVSTDVSYTFTVSENVSLVAKFNQWPLVSISSGAYGSVSFENSAETSLFVQSGSEVTVIATPDKNCDFLGWFIGYGKEPVSTDVSYTFTVSENVSLVAKFNQWPLVSISSAANGSVSFENSAETSLFVQSGSEVTVIATPDKNCDFLGWFIGYGEEPVSTDATYTFTVVENVTLVAKFVNYNGHEYVDLGLPSGLKWATCNVGANKPEEYGGYYAWGETEEKSNYVWSTYKWCNGSYDTMTKYCISGRYGTADYKTVLDPEDDVAHVKWGGDWRMPTKEEQDELRKKCTWAWTTLNGVNGYRVTGPNGNSIFLPAAGVRYGTAVGGRGDIGKCWSSSLYFNDSSLNHKFSDDKAYYLHFSDSGYDWYDNDRYNGQSVRPVLK